MLVHFITVLEQVRVTQNLGLANTLNKCLDKSASFYFKVSLLVLQSLQFVEDMGCHDQ